MEEFRICKRSHIWFEGIWLGNLESTWSLLKLWIFSRTPPILISSELTINENIVPLFYSVGDDWSPSVVPENHVIPLNPPVSTSHYPPPSPPPPHLQAIVNVSSLNIGILGWNPFEHNSVIVKSTTLKWLCCLVVSTESVYGHCGDIGNCLKLRNKLVR